MSSEKISIKSILMLLGGIGTLGLGSFAVNFLNNNQIGNTTTTTIGGSTTTINGVPEKTTEHINGTGKAEPVIRIPQEGNVVEREILMTGTLNTLNSNENIWAYVYAPGEKRYYPTQAVYRLNDKTWRAPLVIGSTQSDNSGASFQIGVFTANTSLATDLKSAGERGMNNLPVGVKPLTEITVKRK
jgi:hypothetical protein